MLLLQVVETEGIMIVLRDGANDVSTIELKAAWWCLNDYNHIFE